MVEVEKKPLMCSTLMFGTLKLGLIDLQSATRIILKKLLYTLVPMVMLSAFVRKFDHKLMKVGGTLQRTIPKIGNKHSQKRNCATTVPMFTFICLWAIYIFSWSICLFYCRKYVDWSGEYANCSQKHDCGNWDWGRPIPRKGIHKWDFCCSAGSLTLSA